MVMLLTVLIACSALSGTTDVTVEAIPVEAEEATEEAPLRATPTQWPTPVNQPWRTIAIGVELRDLPVHGPHFRFPATAHLVRLDPSLVKIHTHYSPEVPITVEDWQRETRAMVVINGGFFTPAQQSEGLMVGFNQPYGTSYREGGMFYLQNGQAGLRNLSEEPYRDNEQFDEAMQSYPLLVDGGEAIHPFEDYRYNRRTAIGVDGLGRVVLMTFDEPVVSLNEMSHWLAASDLELEMALNLDGGSSTGMAVVTEDETILYNSHGPIPIVIAAYP
jgi:hypothetical protein